MNRNYAQYAYFAFLASLFLFFVSLLFAGVVYVADDKTVISKLGANDLETLLSFHFRVIEFVVASASYYWFDKLWLVVTLVMYALTAYIMGMIYTVTIQKEERVFSMAQFVMLAAIANPLLAQLLSQIDTVSQVSGNLFAVLCLYSLIRFDRTSEQRQLFFAGLWSMVALLCKETFIGLPLLPAFYIARQIATLPRGERYPYYLALMTMLVFGIAYLVLKFLYGGIGGTTLDESVTRYNFHWNIVTLGEHLVFGLSAPVNIVPTSLIGLSWGKPLYVAVGILLFFLVLLLFAKAWLKNAVPKLVLFWYATLLAPLVLVHMAELYISVFPLSLFLIVTAVFRRKAATRKTVMTIGPVLFLASLFNLMVLTSTKCELATRVAGYQCEMIDTRLATMWYGAEYSIYNYPLEPPALLGTDLQQAVPNSRK